MLHWSGSSSSIMADTLQPSPLPAMVRIYSVSTACHTSFNVRIRICKVSIGILCVYSELSLYCTPGLPLLYVGALTVPLGFVRNDNYRHYHPYDYGYEQA